MAPKKKTQKENKNFMFMTEMKPKLESDGHKFPGGLMDVHPVCTPLRNNLTTEQKAIYTQRASPVMKEDYEVEEETIGSVPRLPNSYSKVVMKLVGPRVAANFGKPQSVIPGAGRGILVIGSVPGFHRGGILAKASLRKLISEPITPGPPSQESAPSTTAGRGHGRVSLLIND